MNNENRTRNHRVQVRLSDYEYDCFIRQLERTDLTKEAYLRKIITDRTPKTKELSQLDRDIATQLYAIGNNLNQIARKANDMGVISIDKFDCAVKDFKDIMTKFLGQM